MFLLLFYCHVKLFFRYQIQQTKWNTVICTNQKKLKVKPNIAWKTNSHENEKKKKKKKRLDTHQKCKKKKKKKKKIGYTSQMQKKSNLTYCAISKNSKTWERVTTQKNSDGVNMNMKWRIVTKSNIITKQI